MTTTGHEPDGQGAGNDGTGTRTTGTEGPGTHGPGTDTTGIRRTGTEGPGAHGPGADTTGIRRTGTDGTGTRTTGAHGPGTHGTGHRGTGQESFTALTSFTGDARPYRGGDPYADYRGAELPFDGLVNLADRRLGAGAIAASDEFFAERENLLLPERPVFDPGRFGHKGKIMDGWETRRRRGPSVTAALPAPEDHDWVLVRLGAPGIVRSIVVDTAHFRGNHPRAVSIQATEYPLPGGPEELLATGTAWTPLVPPTPVGGHAENAFAVHVERRFTHVRVCQHPDGGIARLRVHGEVVPDPGWLARLGTFDLVALENGGTVEDASDRFYSPPEHTIFPGRSRRMDDGWETRRRRDGGPDWIRYRLAGQAVIRAVEVDTACLKGNSAGWVALWARDGEEGEWREFIPGTRLQPDSLHRFPVGAASPATHVRLDVFPDGGISRLRLYGSLTEAGRRRLAERAAAAGFRQGSGR